MKIEKNKVVSINYTLTDNKGITLDTSAGREPLKFIHGIGHIIVGLEEALEGKIKGDKLNVAIAPEKGYGLKNEEMIQKIPRNQFDASQPIEPGMQFNAQAEEGRMIVVTVTKVEDDFITIDANHPLAGETLNFDVEIIEIREASPEELSHGHVH